MSNARNRFDFPLLLRLELSNVILGASDPEYMPELGPQQYVSTPTWDEGTASLTAAQRANAVNAITSISKEAGLVSTGFLEVDVGANAVANNKGLFGYNRSTTVALTTTIRTPDGTGSGWAGTQANDFSKIDSAALGRRSCRRRSSGRVCRPARAGPRACHPPCARERVSRVSPGRR